MTIPSNYFIFEPLKNIKLRRKLIQQKHNIYLATTDGKLKVYKLFDLTTKSFAKPNVKIVEEVLSKNYLMNIKEIPLSSNGHFRCLSYDYIEASSTSDLSIEDFKPIVRDLDKLHNNNSVHSDVRLCNMVFPADRSEAKLIDFDLMDKVDDLMCLIQRYNDSSKVPEHHTNAGPMHQSVAKNSL